MSIFDNIPRLGMLGIGAALTALLGACQMDDDSNVPNVPVSYVSIYNAIPDAPELDLTVDSRLVAPRGMRFGDNAYYQNFYTGERNFQITPFGANNVVADTTVSLLDGNAYSLFLVNEFSNATFLFTNDSAAISEEGKVKVRLINLSPDASPVSLQIKNGSNALVGSQPFKGVSEFVALDPGTHDFQIAPTGGEQPLEIPAIELGSGAVRTFVVRGYKNPPSGNNHTLSAQMLLN